MMVIDFLVRSFELDFGGWLVLWAFGGFGYVLLSQMLDHGTALLGTPILVVSAAAGNLGLAMAGVQMASDKILNMTVGMAAGMFAGAILLVAILWSWNASLAR